MAHEFRLPRLGDSFAEGIIQEWLVDVGDTVEVDQPVCVIETTKTMVDVPCPHAGVVLYRGGEIKDTIELDAVLLVVGEEGETWEAEEAVAVGTAPATAPEPASVATASSGETKVLPAARKLAGELGVDLTAIIGSGPGGLIKPDDVRAAVEGSGIDREERVAMSAVRKAIAQNLLKSWQSIPHASMGWQADMGPFLERRKLASGEFGKKIRPEAMLMLAVIPLLRGFPALNARVDGNDLVYYKDLNIGFAVAADEGLLVAVVRGADSYDLPALSDEIQRLSEAAATGRLKPEELSGITFTVNNVGPLGLTNGGNSILPLGTSGVLGMERARPTPVVGDDGSVVVKSIGNFVMTYDHRALDGAHVAQFLKKLTSALEAGN